MRAWAWPICAHLAGIAVHMVPHGRMGTNLLCSKTSWLFRMPQVGSPERRTDIGQYNAFSRCLQIEEFVVGQCFVWIFAGKQDCRLPWPHDAQVAGEAHASVNQWFYWVPELSRLMLGLVCPGLIWTVLHLKVDHSQHPMFPSVQVHRCAQWIRYLGCFGSVIFNVMTYITKTNRYELKSKIVKIFAVPMVCV